MTTLPTATTLAGAAAVALACAPLAAQTLDDLRADLRGQLAEVKFAKALGTLVLASEEMSLSSADFSFDDDEGTELSTFVLPLQSTFDLFGAGRPGLHVEGALGHARVRQSTADVYDGGLPGLQTSITTDWQSLSGVVGVGPALPLAARLTFTPMANLGFAHLENDSDYDGPGAPLTAALADGIAFNWDATVVITGAAARLDWRQRLDALRLDVVARYDLRWLDVVQADDPAQDFTTRMQVATLRADLVGPTGWRLLDGAVDWRALAGYRGFVEGDLFGNRSLFEVGGALELRSADDLPLVDGLAVHASAFFGDDLRGWSVGVGVLF